MSPSILLSHLDAIRETGHDKYVARCPSHDVLLVHPKRIESTLRNGLPTDDNAEASTFTHAHSEIESLLESIDEGWWMK